MVFKRKVQIDTTLENMYAFMREIMPTATHVTRILARGLSHKDSHTRVQSPTRIARGSSNGGASHEDPLTRVPTRIFPRGFSHENSTTRIITRGLKVRPPPPLPKSWP